jgi:hypothetical protein
LPSNIRHKKEPNTFIFGGINQSLIFWLYDGQANLGASRYFDVGASKANARSLAQVVPIVILIRGRGIIPLPPLKKRRTKVRINEE